ncbi:MAG: hypothetical protein J6C29_03225 [Clostridia bacterium]|nr:hypothetical protein [Clostridia bacterium]
MNSQVLEKILEQLSGIIETAGFKANEDKTEYKNEKVAFKIGHDEEKKLLLLDIAQIGENGEVGEYSNASSWLFENPEELRDAESAGMDFFDTLKGKIGMKGTRINKNGEIAMPSKEKSGNSFNVEAFCAKMLAIYPQLKEEYKNHIAEYGSFLYIDFFKTHIVPQIEKLLDENNKKSLKKVFPVLDDVYVNGDRTVQNVVVGVVLCGAVKDNESRYQAAMEAMAEHQFLKVAFFNIMKRYKTDKAFKAMLD